MSLMEIILGKREKSVLLQLVSVRKLDQINAATILSMRFFHVNSTKQALTA